MALSRDSFELTIYADSMWPVLGIHPLKAVADAHLIKAVMAQVERNCHLAALLRNQSYRETRL